jgi:hypothetical protein
MTRRLFSSPAVCLTAGVARGHVLAEAVVDKRLQGSDEIIASLGVP